MALGSLFRLLRRRSIWESEMDEELRFHIEAYREDLIRAGTRPGEAERQARLRFGSASRVREECREARGLRWPDELRRNLLYGIRLLRKSPGFAATAVATLALCIGANTAIYSVIDAVLLRPLPFPEPDRLAQVTLLVQSRNGSGINDSQDGLTWEMLRDHAGNLEVAGMSGGFAGVNLAVNGAAEYVQQQRITAGFFHVLRVPLAMGREFTAEEDRAGRPRRKRAGRHSFP